MKADRLELATNSADAGLWLLDLSTNVFWMNQKTRDLFCFPRAKEITFQHLLDKVHPDDHHIIREGMHRALQDGGTHTIEYRIFMPDGSIRWIHVRGSAHTFLDDTSSCLTGVAIDITKRKMSELTSARLLCFETLLSEISASFVRYLLPTDIDDLIEQSLEKIMVFFDGDRCGLVRLDLKERSAFVTHSTQKEGLERISHDVDLAPLLPWSFNLLKEGWSHTFSELDELTPEAAIDRRTYEAMGVRSALRYPVRVDDNVFYVLAVQSLVKRISWPAEALPRMGILCEVFINAIYKKRVELELSEAYEEIASLKNNLAVEADCLRDEVRVLKSHDLSAGNGNEAGATLPHGENSITEMLTLEEVERHHIEKVLRITNWQIKGGNGAARILDINPSTLYSRMKKLGIPLKRKTVADH